VLLLLAAEPATAAALASATAIAAGVCLNPVLYLSPMVGMPMTLLPATDLALLLLVAAAAAVAVSAGMRSGRAPPVRCPAGAAGFSLVGLPPAAALGALALLPNAPAADGSERVAARIAALPGLLAGLLPPAPVMRPAGLALRLAAAVLLLLLLAPASEPRSLAMCRLCADALLASTLLPLARTLLPAAPAPPAVAAARAAGLGVLLR
jgi:hypothetical protein